MDTKQVDTNIYCRRCKAFLETRPVAAQLLADLRRMGGFFRPFVFCEPCKKALNVKKDTPDAA